MTYRDRLDALQTRYRKGIVVLGLLLEVDTLMRKIPFVGAALATTLCQPAMVGVMQGLHALQAEAKALTDEAVAQVLRATLPPALDRSKLN